MVDLDKKIEIAKKRIQNIKDKHKNIFVGHSGGKDSSVVMHLALNVLGNDIKIIHNVKNIKKEDDNSLTNINIRTLEFLYDYVSKNSTNNLIFVPSNKMEEYIKKYNLELQIDGTRLEEFTRENKSSTFIHNGIEVSRVNMEAHNPNGLFGISFLYPIYDWSYKDVFNYHTKYNIPLSKEYLNDNEYIKFMEESDK